MRPASSARTLSVRAHLLLLVAGTMIPVLVLATILVRRVVADNRDAVERRLLEGARAEAILVDSELDGSIRALQGLAESDRLTAGDIPGFYTQATHLLQTQPTWANISLSLPDRQQISNTTRPLGTPLPFAADRESFGRALTTQKPAIGNLRVGSITGQLGFLVRVPVVRDNRVLYIVSAWITSDRFAPVLHRQAVLADEWVRGVLDASATIVARSHEPDRFVGQKATAEFLSRSNHVDEGVYRDTALDGSPVYAAYSRAPLSRWTAAVAVRASAIDGSFRQSMSILTAIAGLLLALGGGGVYVISRRISHDIGQSVAEAEAIAGGRSPSPTVSHVTELKRLLDALERSAELLRVRQRERDDEVARADQARSEAEAANRAKDEFLAMLGHELRNPLAPALTALHLMKLRNGADTSREREVIERQIRHMARLVDDLLDVSRLRRGAIALRREQFELADAVTRAVEMTAPAFTDKQHQLDVQVPPGLTIDGDKVRVAQVLSNLLSNAAKYTEPKGRVSLRARGESGYAVIECQDNGIGIPAELLPRVFDLFVQGQRGLDRRQGGLGLGLAVARTLVELQGGSIEATSEGTSRGTTFVVRLPLAPTAQPSHDEPDQRQADLAMRHSGLRVLVVEDNHDALDMLVDALKAAGIEAHGAASSAEALELAAGIRPHVAVLDVGLPEMDGFQLARALRAIPLNDPLRLIALTGYGQERDMISARAAGFDAFFVKPIDMSILLEALTEPPVSQ